MSERIGYRTCPLCEAGCGLEITLHDADGTTTVGRIRGDLDDVMSRGYICPKGSQLGHLHDDPDRVRSPLVKRDGRFVEVGWDEAFATIEAGLMPLLAQRGRDACGIYLGNPGAHSLTPLLTNGALIAALGSTNRFSASTVDQRPKELSAGLMFGSVAVPVPDLDRTDLLVMLGANPHASNGSLCTAPDFPGRLDRLQARGGRLVVIDPRRTETAERADTHLPIIPGTDALLLAALAQQLIERAGSAGAATGWLADHCLGLDELDAVLAPFTPAAVAGACGLDEADIVTLADDLGSATTAAVYGRIGTCTQEFGTTASWLVDIVNLVSGNLDAVGGAMFAKGATGQPSTKGKPGIGRGVRVGRRRSRVSGQPETFGEYSVSVMAEEIETEGDGQIKAMIVIAGNPVSSCPNSNRIDAAFASLDFMVSVDLYINETSRHADVILPAPSPLQKSHYDVALANFAVHNAANYSPALLPLDEGQLSEWDLTLRLIGILIGEGSHADTSPIDAQFAATILSKAIADEHSPVHGRDVDELLAALDPHTGPERVLDALIRVGPYGDGFGANPDGLTLATLIERPHGVDLGPLQPGRIPDVLRTESGKVEVLPDLIRSDLPRLAARLADDRGLNDLVLVGRRHVRSNNSWMHNMRVLMKGRQRCTVQIHPDDADRLGVTDGETTTVTSRVGTIALPAEVTDSVRPGVISIPHGFGQDLPGVQLAVAQAYGGANTNVVTDDACIDPLSGNIALNGVPVRVTASA